MLFRRPLFGQRPEVRIWTPWILVLSPTFQADSNVAKLITIGPIDQRSEGKSIPEERLSNFEIEC